ncbi:MAG: NAD-dependent malic enzyme [Gammaproteobacteria bacterium]|nr:NAD-dependent malic enzyme [Gammaproteobacteria bacterium]MCY4217857.1 NAD-dependent malic enzyme [Gammaproteobacteria bacterium]MCY4274957.1 NAD-dependent malic enzyme [Gammaproteobacteria bacterium]
MNNNYHGLTGVKLLHNAAHNKSTAFTEMERDQYGLRGLLPPAVGSMNTQIQRVLANMRRKESDIEKYIFLSMLQDRNERLFFRLIMDNFQELLPIVYTPTVGQACREFANIFRTEKGFYVTAKDRGRIRKILDNWPNRDVRIIVITDGGRILGLGDLGANGMGIPLGKLGLYCACAGISPNQTLPVMFDVGTNNEDLIEDPIYLGLRQPRLQGDEYFSLMDEFIDAAQDAFPGVLIQFEDFTAENAFTHLNAYREKVLCFNDDIQGTASVVLAGIYASTRFSGIPFRDLKFLFLGAGSAATGMGNLIVEALIESGLEEQEAVQRLWFFNRVGLIRKGITRLPDYIQRYAHDVEGCQLLDAIDIHRPDILIGATGTPATFTQELIHKMASIKSKPGIFALSNPTSRAECTAEEAYEWTGGRAIFASGSPFDDVMYDGRLIRPGQGNNAYIFPGVGLGAIVCKAKYIPDEMFLVAAKVLADSLTDEDIEHGSVYPRVEKIRRVSLNIATAVATYAWDNDIAQMPRPNEINSHIEEFMYDPTY